MKNFKSLSLLILFLYLLSVACKSNKKPLATLQINKLSTTTFMNQVETTLDLKAGNNLVFGIDIDMHYEDEVDLGIDVRIIKNKFDFGGMKVDPRKIEEKTDEILNSNNGKVDWSFKGKLLEFPIQETATYTFKTAVVIDNNQSFKLNKAELTIKKD